MHRNNIVTPRDFAVLRRESTTMQQNTLGTPRDYAALRDADQEESKICNKYAGGRIGLSSGIWSRLCLKATLAAPCGRTLLCSNCSDERPGTLLRFVVFEPQNLLVSGLSKFFCI